MRKLIAGMKVSIDGKVEGPDGTAGSSYETLRSSRTGCVSLLYGVGWLA